MRVLITGHRGYLGCHITELLREAGHTTIGCDKGLFDGCQWEPIPAADFEWERDFREIGVRDLERLDTIVHLASGFEDEGDVAFAQRAKEAGVSRFLLAGSCTLYEGYADEAVDETAPLSPCSYKARNKAKIEAEILSLADPNFCPTSLRFAKAYGSSPMLRVDLIVNELIASAYTTGVMSLEERPSGWQSLIHCHDLARCVLELCQIDEDRIRGKAVNVGSNSENYQSLEIARAVQELLPQTELHHSEQKSIAAPTPPINFDFLGELLPSFHMDYHLHSGLEELLEDFQEHSFDAEDYYGRRFVRRHWLVPHSLNFDTCARSFSV